MKTHTMTEAKNDIYSIIRQAEKEEVLITRHGQPAAVITGLNDSLKKPTPRSKLRGIYGFFPSGPAVVLRGVFSEPCSELQGMIKFKDVDDWFEYKLEHDEKFLKKVAKARKEILKGQYVTLDELPD